MNAERRTLTQFLIDERRRFPGATGELNGLLLSVALACKTIATHVGRGALAVREPPVPGPEAQSEEGKYLLVFDPLDGSSNLDLNVCVGSIFSVLRAPQPRAAGAIDEQSLLQRGADQVAAGYAIYGPSTMLVLSVGSGTHAFTLDRAIGEFMLTHRDLRVPERTSEFAINSSNSRFWEPPIKRYVGECLAGAAGSRGRDFNMRWIASLVAEAHRILMRGGVFLYPRDRRDPLMPGRLRLLCEANPIGFLVEQAGGRASTGQSQLLQLLPTALDQRTGLVFGSREEVERIESYHAEGVDDAGIDLPLFQTRGLFRDPMAA